MTEESSAAIQEKTRQSFKRAEISEQDAAIALELFGYVRSLNEIIFDDDPCELIFYLQKRKPEPWPDSMMVCYIPETPEDKESYVLFPRGIRDFLDPLPLSFLSIEEGGQKVRREESGRIVSRAVFLFSVAARLVRYRMQDRLSQRLRIFSPCCRSERILTQAVTDFVASYFKMAHKEEGRGLPSDEDFDAKVIEILVQHRMGSCRNAQDIRNMLWEMPLK